MNIYTCKIEIKVRAQNRKEAWDKVKRIAEKINGSVFSVHEEE